jgi:hypothetical protein
VSTGGSRRNTYLKKSTGSDKLRSFGSAFA